MNEQIVIGQHIENAAVTICIPASVQHAKQWLYRAAVSAYAQTVPCTVKWLIDTETRRAAWVRNRLVESVDTPFIVFLDADDVLHPRFIERTLDVWKPGSYVYTDMLMPSPDGTIRQVPAISCYGFDENPGEAKFHHTTTLFPTIIYRKLGGMDEELYGGEDTEFYLKANANRVRSIALRQALMMYTPDGHYSVDAQSRPTWAATLETIYKRYAGFLDKTLCSESKWTPELEG